MYIIDDIIIDEGVFLEHIQDRYDKYLPIKVLDDDKTLLMPLIQKCACSTIANLYYNLNISQTEIHDEHTHYMWGKYYVHDKYVNVDDYENRLCVAIIRDPLERLESSYKTFCEFGHNEYAEKYPVFVINTLKSYNEDKESRNKIDRHIASQFSAYDIDKIDLFVQINDLDRFLVKCGINKSTNVNVSKNKFRFSKEDKNTILNLLHEDYLIYNQILSNKNKLFV